MWGESKESPGSAPPAKTKEEDGGRSTWACVAVAAPVAVAVAVPEPVPVVAVASESERERHALERARDARARHNLVRAVTKDEQGK